MSSQLFDIISRHNSNHVVIVEQPFLCGTGKFFSVDSSKEEVVQTFGVLDPSNIVTTLSGSSPVGNDCDQVIKASVVLEYQLFLLFCSFYLHLSILFLGCWSARGLGLGCLDSENFLLRFLRCCAIGSQLCLKLFSAELKKIKTERELDGLDNRQSQSDVEL